MSGEFMPMGFRFNPTDPELIEYFLYPKISYGAMSFIEDMDVYGCEPWLLPHKINPGFKANEWYYFVKRTKGPGKNINGKRPRRTVAGDGNGGTWKATDGETPIHDQNRNIIGYKQSLTFFLKQEGQRNGTKSDWLMKEYRLASNTFQEWVLCRIRYKPKQKSPVVQGSTPTAVTAPISESISTGMMMGNNGEGLCPNQENSEFSSFIGSTSVERSETYNNVLVGEEVQQLQPIEYASIFGVPQEDVSATIEAEIEADIADGLTLDELLSWLD